MSIHNMFSWKNKKTIIWIPTLVWSYVITRNEMLTVALLMARYCNKGNKINIDHCILQYPMILSVGIEDPDQTA